MATNPSTLPENSGRITAPDANYPYGSAKNDSTGTTGDGTPIRAPLMNDTYGFYQALLTRAGITPSGLADTALVSQLADAVVAVAGIAAPAVVGASRNATIRQTAAGATVAFTADEVVVAVSLTGRHFRLANISETINLATTGAGGMDTGLAPVSGYLALYLIYNPTSGAVDLLGRDVTSILAGEVYGGANMPAGYTASALIAVVPTNASRQVVALFVNGRSVDIAPVTVLNASSVQRVTATQLSISSAVPINAIKHKGFMNIGSSAGSSSAMNIGGGGEVEGQQGTALNAAAAGNITGSFSGIPIRRAAPQTLFYTATVTAGTMSATIAVTGYDF